MTSCCCSAASSANELAEAAQSVRAALMRVAVLQAVGDGEVLGRRTCMREEKKEKSEGIRGEKSEGIGEARWDRTRMTGEISRCLGQCV